MLEKVLSNSLLSQLPTAYRMGRMIAKVGIVFAVSKYNFEPTDYKELEFDSASVTLQAKNGINLKIMNR